MYEDQIRQLIDIADKEGRLTKEEVEELVLEMEGKTLNEMKGLAAQYIAKGEEEYRYAQAMSELKDYMRKEGITQLRSNLVKRFLERKGLSYEKFLSEVREGSNG